MSIEVRHSRTERLQLRLAMESLARSVLKKYHEQFKTSDMDPALVADKLQEARIVTDVDAEKARKENVSASERWDDLLLAIMRNSAESILQKFIDILLREKELEHLGNEIKGNDNPHFACLKLYTIDVQSFEICFCCRKFIWHFVKPFFSSLNM